MINNNNINNIARECEENEQNTICQHNNNQYHQQQSFLLKKFQFLAKFIDRIFLSAVRKCFTFIRIAGLEFQLRYINECKPLRSNNELLNIQNLTLIWQDMVEPLAIKCKPIKLNNKFEEFEPSSLLNTYDTYDERPEVLICHDLAGNYRSDRFINGSTKWDDYRFYHWSGIDYFCYFSHEYITIPTLPWINAAHKHGVKVLGTFIVESIDGRRRLEEVLQSEEYMNKIVDSIVILTKRCNIEGWLLNIECELNPDKIPMLQLFIKYFTEQIHMNIENGTVIWYDSIINNGKLLWQNELNEKNKLFYDLCDGIFLNYNWNEINLEKTAESVQNISKEMKKVFVGIDIFGRGQIAKFQTVETLKKIRKYNFSVAIFAPGWTYETLNELGVDIYTKNGTTISNTHFIQRNNRFWELLWPYLYTSGPMKLPFYTNFCIGSGQYRFQDGLLSSSLINQPSISNWINLSNQSYQPSVPLGNFERVFDVAFTGGSCIKILPTNLPKRLFLSNFQCYNNQLILSYAFKQIIDDNDDMSIWLNVVCSNNRKYCQIILCGDAAAAAAAEGGVDNENQNIDKGKIYLKPINNVNLETALIIISERQEHKLPISNPTGWCTRYYIINFDLNVTRPTITDIGVHTTNHSGVYLGAIHIHEGQKHDERNDDFFGIKKITSEHFKIYTNNTNI